MQVFDRVMFLLLVVMGAMLCNAAYSLIRLNNLGFSDDDALFIFKVIVIAAFFILWFFMIAGNIKALVNLKKNSKTEPVIVLGTAQLKGAENGTFPKYIRQKYFLALCLMYPNLGGTLQEIQAVGLGQQPELSDNCRGYIQGFMRALMDSRGSPLPVEALVQANAFVMKLLIDTDVLKSFVKDFKDNIEETIELIVNSNQEY